MGPGEEETLGVADAVQLEEVGLGLGFHPLRDQFPA